MHYVDGFVVPVPRVMKDPRVADCRPEDMPFDGMRMFWGGFTGLVGLGWGA